MILAGELNILTAAVMAQNVKAGSSVYVHRRSKLTGLTRNSARPSLAGAAEIQPPLCTCVVLSSCSTSAAAAHRLNVKHSVDLKAHFSQSGFKVTCSSEAP